MSMQIMKNVQNPCRKAHQLSHFCPPIATNLLNNSSLSFTAVTLYVIPLRSVISSPSATVVPVAHPTTIFAFHPKPPIFFNSVISWIGTLNFVFALDGSKPVPSLDLLENDTVGMATLVLMQIQPLFP